MDSEFCAIVARVQQSRLHITDSRKANSWWRMAVIQKMKRCSLCGKMLAESKFSKNASEKSGLECQCRECRAKSRKAYRDAAKRYKKVHKLDSASMVSEYKSASGCIICGEEDPLVLVFHHREPANKTNAVSQGVKRGWSRKKLLLEMLKCDVLCANCHKKLHFNNGECKKQKSKLRSSIVKRLAIISERKELGCIVCGEKNSSCLVFHHINQDDKRFSISAAARMTKAITDSEFIAEMGKCDVLCANCHMKLHNGYVEEEEPMENVIHEVTGFMTKGPKYYEEEGIYAPTVYIGKQIVAIGDGVSGSTHLSRMLKPGVKYRVRISEV